MALGQYKEVKFSRTKSKIVKNSGVSWAHPYINIPKVFLSQTSILRGRFVFQSTTACETSTMETTALQLKFSGGARTCRASAAFTARFKKHNSLKCFLKIYFSFSREVVVRIYRRLIIYLFISCQHIKN